MKHAARAAALCGMLLAPAGGAQAGPAPEPALVHHAVGTTSAAAQRAFDEGLSLIYAFNREEARKRFERAALADPKLAMAYWGVALAVGPNLNEDMSPEDLTLAQAALKHAVALEGGAQNEERRYIDALALRYPKSAKDRTAPSYAAYRDAMQKLFADFPLDDDAAALSVESAMDVDDWGWLGTTPIGPTAAMVATLQAVLVRDPDHVGANHYLVHLLDAPIVAQGAEASARRLSALPVEAAASHLVHMAGHTDLDLGLFAPLLREEREAVELDRAYAAAQQMPLDELTYFGHNLDFFAGGAIMLDDREQIAAALELAQKQSPYAALLIQARLGRWDDILATPLPKNNRAAIGWHYARTLALCARKDPVAAQAEYVRLESAVKASGRANFLDPMLRMARAQVAAARGDVSAAEDTLRGIFPEIANYPPEVFAPWFFPAGEWLGWLMLTSGDYAGAETAFRNDLIRTPHNPRTLDGLMRSLADQGRAAEARQYADELAANWRGPLSDLHAAEI